MIIVFHSMRDLDRYFSIPNGPYDVLNKINNSMKCLNCGNTLGSHHCETAACLAYISSSYPKTGAEGNFFTIEGKPEQTFEIERDME